MYFGTFEVADVDIDQSWNHGHMQEVAAMSPSILEMTKDLILAEIRSGVLAPEDMQGALRRTYQSMLSLKSIEESASPVSTPLADIRRAPMDWRTSITRHTITCLECGAHLRQLTGNHLRQHGLNARTYRLKYGIPHSQSLAARETAAKRRQIAAEVRPWEKAPAYVKAQEKKTAAAKKAGRKKGTRKR
jgi:predicted transcriptional regulator